MMTFIQAFETPRMTGGQADPVRTTQDTSSTRPLLLALSDTEKKKRASSSRLRVLKPVRAALKAALHKMRVHVGQDESC